MAFWKPIQASVPRSLSVEIWGNWHRISAVNFWERTGNGGLSFLEARARPTPQRVDNATPLAIVGMASGFPIARFAMVVLVHEVVAGEFWMEQAIDKPEGYPKPNKRPPFFAVV